MDWFHRINIGALIGLGLITLLMLAQHELSGGNNDSPQFHKIDLKKRYQEIISQNKRIFGPVLLLEKKGEWNKAMEALRKILSEHPDNPYGLVIMGRLQYQSGDLADAIHSYREAVEKDPDYVDKTTPLFIGDEILKLINQSRSKLFRERKLKPGDKKIKMAIDDLYYLQRRVAGGCE